MNRPSVYIETSIVSYLTARPSPSLRAAAWQQVTVQWWEQERARYSLFISELVVVEASAGDREAAGSRLAKIRGIAGLPIDAEVRTFAARLIAAAFRPKPSPMLFTSLSLACTRSIICSHGTAATSTT